MAGSNKAKSQKKGPAARPSLDENALSQLTSKIDKALSKSEDRARPGKRKRQDDDDKRAKPTKRQPASESRKKSGGESRDAKNKNALLLEDIKALGGDEDDLELVVGIDSDAEEGAAKPVERELDDVFRSELAKFASGLGFENVRDDLEDESDEEEVEAGGGPQDQSDSESEEESADEDQANESAPTPASKAPAPAPAPPAATKEPSMLAEKSKDRHWAGKLMIEPRPDWHAATQGNLPAPSTDEVAKFGSAIASLKAYAQSLLNQDTAAYGAATSSSSSHKFMTTIMTSGTLSDKISALTLAVQESPVHNVKALDSLLAMAGKKSRSQAIAALGALVDLLGNGVVLPSDRRLRPFSSQPGLLGSLQQCSVGSWKEGQALPGGLTKAHLIMWIYEDWLKSAFFKLLQLLEVWSGDEIDYSRSRTLDFIFGLLRDKPEQEANLMRLLVSKLSDREGKIASRASYLLQQLVNTHPGMKPIVIRSIEHEVLLRPGQNLRTKYHAINTLNQTILSSKEPEIADNLVRIYFEMFLSLLRSGSLGIFDHLNNNAGDDGKPPQKKPRGKKDRKASEQSTANEQDVAQKLVSAVLVGVNRAIPFAMTNESTLETHLDTLFRITHSSNFNTSVQALILIQQIAASKHLAVDRFYRTLYESLLDPRLMTSSKQTLYLNLLYRALKDDVDVRRVKAFVKRMLQVVNLHQPSFVCGILYLVAELEGTFPDLKTLLTDPEDNEDDEEEVYKDADAVDQDKPAAKVDARKNTARYDPRKRNPEFSNAHRSCLWELVPYFSHYHPSVVVFANNLLVRQKSLPKPELANHTLIQFLDKFVYRNAKATETKRGGSIMQPVMASGAAVGAVTSGKGATKTPSTLNSEAFWKLKPQEVSPEDVFFHEYFTQVGKSGQQSRAAKREQKRAEEEAGDEEAGEDEAEDEIWQALVDSRPDIQGDDDGDADTGFSDGDSDLASLLNMSDSGDDGDDSDDEGSAGLKFMDEGSDGGVEFNDFSDSEEEAGKEEPAEDDDVPLDQVAQAKRERNKKSRMRKKELKAMPTFASADDYAAMLAQEEDGF
ncbi:ribosome biogenesis protein MAK21 [Magnaporthiopsis poae ATCC 64411]|uniref:Ribosome biogenesis protein MAK21 n=1 Tax=Magnaporthiopsis poae (strain ATCC 64411 / 73-15) TaxID=644358 RepID=A0A0C4E6Z8_MAGP6|nr:ribosome biogenesis protein MAK21 [Magnaporthiopsis poae ATCC 64411]